MSDFNWLSDAYGTEICMDERSKNLIDAMINTPDNVVLNTPLHYACKFGPPEIVDLLLSYQVNNF